MAHLWVNDSDVHFSPKLSEFLRYSSQPLLKFRQFADVKDAMGRDMGDNFNFPKVANVSGPGGRIVETSTMPQAAQTLTKGTLTITEYGNSVPFTFKIDVLSQFDLEQIVDRGLKDDLVKILDAGVEEQFNACQLRLVGTATDGHVLTTDGTATATNTSVLNERHIRKMRLELEARNVPTLADDTYAFIGSLEAVDSLLGSLVDVNQHTPAGYTKILNGEQVIVNGVRIIKDNNATRFTYDLDSPGTAAVAKTTFDTSGVSGEGYMLGRDTVMEGVAVPEQVRAKEVTDYGRSKGLAWYFLGGWKIIWDDEPNAKIIKWDSAA
jgi:N4-gp56 family major capsid protein